MNHDEVRSVLREMGATWRQEITDDQVLAWTDTLAPLDYALTISALRQLKIELEWLPTHANLVAAVKAEAVRATAPPPGMEHPPDRCALCDGTGWEPANVVKGDAVVRCRCQDRPRATTDAPHPSSCSCRACYYGGRGAAIAAGVDGFARVGADPLTQVPSPARTPYGGDG